MDIFHYYVKNDTGGDLGLGHYLDEHEIAMLTWERTHHSPFAYYYGLHAELEAEASRRNGSLGVNATELLRHRSRDLVKFSIECVAITVVGVPGIFGNILSAIVLLTAKMRSPITYLLLGLALTDLLMILNCLLGMAVPNYCLYYKIDLFHYRFAAFLPVIFSIGKTAHVASVLYALFITMERYFAVMYPLKARLFCTLTRAKITSIVILVFSIVYNIPRFFEYTYVKVPVYIKHEDEEESATADTDYYYFPLTADLRRNEIYRRFIVVMHYSLFYAIPMVLIIYFNVLIYRKLKLAQKQRETMTVSQISENNVTTMLFIIVIVFMMCNSLPVVNLISRLVTGNPQIYILDSVRNFLWIFNSSVNFVIYYAYSDGFRDTCLEIWQDCFQYCCYPSTRKKRRLKHTNSSGYTYNHSTTSSRMSVVTISSRVSSVKRHFGDTPEGDPAPKSPMPSSQQRSNSIVQS